MSHINVSTPSFRSPSARLLRISDFSGGVRFSDFSERLSDSQSPYLSNFVYSGDILRTRDGTTEVYSELSLRGELHSEYASAFFGYRIFHIGTSLIAVCKNDRRLVSDTLPNTPSFIFEMNSVLYIFTKNAEIYSMDKNLSLSQIPLPQADYLVNAKNDLSEFTKNELPDNCLLYRLTVSYLANENAGLTEFILPHEPDTERKIILTNPDTDSEITVDFTVEGRTVAVSRKIYSKVKISYVPKKGESERHFDKIFGCTCAVTYGGTGSGGTRVFFSGNPEYPGYYFFSDLLDPCTIPLLSYDILGNGSKNVSAMAKQGDDLVVLCTDSIYRITYRFDKDSGADFTVSEINPYVGCDMPKSVRLVDNRLVFASKKGVYIIVSSDYTDELSVRCISSNIDGDKKDGYTALAKSDANSCSVDYNRSYRLCIGNKTFVWDYGNSPYIASADPAYAATALSWYIFEGKEILSLFEEDGELFAIVSKGEEKCFASFCEKEQRDLEAPIHAYLRIRETDLQAPEKRKVLTDLHLTLLSDGKTPVRVTVFADGREIMSEEVLPDVISWDWEETEEKLARIALRVPRCPSYSFSAGIEINGGLLGIYGITMRFDS